MNRPLCRCCGKPIRKRTTTHFLRVNSARAGTMDSGHYAPTHFVAEPIRKREDLARFTNEEIVSVRYEDPHKAALETLEKYPDYYDAAELEALAARGRWIDSFGTWDGESYEDDLFCGVNCAAGWGRLFAKLRPDLMTQAHAEAVRKRQRRAS